MVLSQNRFKNHLNAKSVEKQWRGDHENIFKLLKYKASG